MSHEDASPPPPPRESIVRQKDYACDCGPSEDPSLNCCVRAEKWLTFAFKQKPYSEKDQAIYDELISIVEEHLEKYNDKEDGETNSEE